MALMKLNIMTDTPEIAEGRRLIMEYGHGDYYAAEAYVNHQIETLLGKVQASEEGFMDWLKDVGTYVWNKIKELWNMLCAFVNRLLGRNTLASVPAVRSVLNYGKFPEGYVPTRFENSEYTGTLNPLSKNIGSPNCDFFMRSTSCLTRYLSAMDACVKTCVGPDLMGVISKIYGDLDFPAANEEDPASRLQQFLNASDVVFKPFCTFVMKEKSLLGTLLNLVGGKGNTPQYYKNIDKLLVDVYPANMYEKVHPYLQGGWTSGMAFKGFIGSNGQFLNVKEAVTKAINRYNTEVIDRFDQKFKRMAKLLPAQTQQFVDRFHIWQDQINAFNEVIRKLLVRFSKELLEVEAVIKLNCEAVEEDITKKFQK